MKYSEIRRIVKRSRLILEEYIKSLEGIVNTSGYCGIATKLLLDQFRGDYRAVPVICSFNDLKGDTFYHCFLRYKISKKNYYLIDITSDQFDLYNPRTMVLNMKYWPRTKFFKRADRYNFNYWGFGDTEVLSGRILFKKDLMLWHSDQNPFLPEVYERLNSHIKGIVKHETA
jgi:hypothetical protein